MRMSANALPPGKVTGLEMKSVERYLPYIRIQNESQGEIYDSVYNNKIKRYWLGREVFESITMNNSQHDMNEICRVASSCACPRTPCPLLPIVLSRRFRWARCLDGPESLRWTRCRRYRWLLAGGPLWGYLKSQFSRDLVKFWR